MAFDRQQLRFDYGFNVQGTPEIAHTGVSFTWTAGWSSAVTALGNIDSAGDIVDYYTHFLTFMGTTGLNWATYSDFVTLKIAALDTAGLYLTDPLIFEAIGPHIGAAETTKIQNSEVLSLRSGMTLGRGNYGRMYLPHTSFELVADEPFSNTSDMTTAAAAANTWLDATEAKLLTDTGLAMAVNIMSSVGSGVSRPVTTVGFGNVTDTQRRRRNRLQESYVFDPR